MVGSAPTMEGAVDELSRRTVRFFEELARKDPALALRVLAQLEAKVRELKPDKKV